MKYEKFYYSIATSINSDGLYKPAISIYFNGCDKKVKCKNCQNKELQKPFVGYNNNIDGMINELKRYIKMFLEFNKELRIAFVGGEPLAEYNIEAVYEISKFIKEKYKNSITIVYSWRTIDDINRESLKENLKYIDIGILGEFIEDSFEENIIPASKNQCIYDFKNKKTLNSIMKGEC